MENNIVEDFSRISACPNVIPDITTTQIDLDPVIREIPYQIPPRSRSMWSHLGDNQLTKRLSQFKNLTKRHRSVAEKLWWVLGFTLCIAFFIYSLRAFSLKYNNIPVDLHADDTLISISEIPFPAITICPQEPPPNRTIADRSFNETFVHCDWDKEYNCQNIFQQLMTVHGFCYSFNTPQTYIRVNNDQDTTKRLYLPHKSMKINATLLPHMLKVIMRAETIKSPHPKFKLILHHPHEHPFDLIVSQEVEAGYEYFFKIRPNMTTTNEEVRRIKPERRQCYYPYEQQLQHLMYYNQHNCELECKNNYTTSYCGCNLTDFISKPKLCYKDCMDKTNFNLTSCKCLPECTAVDYKGSIFDQRKFNKSKVVRELALDVEDDTSMTIFQFYFDNLTFRGIRRSARYGMLDLISTYCGFLVLFSGGALLCLIEILNFLNLTCKCCFKKLHDVDVEEDEHSTNQ